MYKYVYLCIDVCHNVCCEFLSWYGLIEGIVPFIGKVSFQLDITIQIRMHNYRIGGERNQQELLNIKDNNKNYKNYCTT